MSKNIILYSDGTGKKGGYGKSTHVYKLYKAIDIHNSEHPQIGYYDNGIGAEENQHKYLQKLAGAFGFGFQRNICDLYEFLARHYDPGDAIYLFGFSRGGATVRALAGMLYACGLVNRYDKQGEEKQPEELKADIAEAINAYEKIATNKHMVNDFKANKALHNQQFVPEGVIPIQFIGVWDTVSALGFPKDFSMTFEWFFNKLDRISDYFWPHNFYDYALNKTIKHAYQALSIDDERKTFWPKVWDESANNFSGVVEQVWFSGIHGNIGGGRARTGLADITMDWMLVRAIQQGLVLKAEVQASIKADADIYDRLYGSREGYAIYYRYQPRDITALCQNHDGHSKLLAQVKVHKTVMQRIQNGTPVYTPAYLPYQFEVVDTPLDAEVIPMQATQDITAWQTNRDQIAKYVKQRQWVYRIFVEFTLLVVLISGWFWANAEMMPIQDADSLNIIDRFFGHIADIFDYFLPVFFENMIHFVIRVHYWIFIGVVIFTVKLINRRTNLQHKLKQASRKICSFIKKSPSVE